MGTVKVSDAFYPYALKRMFADDRGFPIVLEFRSGIMPSKAVLEAQDIYLDDGSGWIDPAKWDAYIASFALVRRWKLLDFSKNIVPQTLTRMEYGFSNRPNADYQLSANAENVFNSGQADWFVIRSMSTDNTTMHYAFTGTITDLEGSGDIRMVRTTLTETDIVLPSSVTIDIGNLDVP